MNTDKHNLIKKLYLEDNLSTIEIGRLLGCSSTVPQRILKKYGLTKSISEAKKNKKIGSKQPKEKIVELYLSGMSSIKISEQIGCSKRTILNILKDNGINGDNKYSHIHEKEDIILKLYLDNKSMLEIVEELKIPYTTINSILKKHSVIRTENKYRIGMNYEDYLKSIPAFKKYKSDVMKTTSKQNIKLLENNEKRCISGIKGCYHLDHKYSILEGFKNGIEPEIIGNFYNLEFIPWEDNIRKNFNCSITIEELINKIKS